MTPPFFSNPHLWGWAAIGAVVLWLVWLLSPILAPFLLAATLAYVLDPVVEKLSRRRLPRTLAVLLVMLLVLLLLVGLALVVLPLFTKELRMLAERVPAFVEWLNRSVSPWLNEHFQVALQFDLDTARQLAASLLAGNQDLVPQLLGSLRIGGLAIVAFLANVLLVPVVLFYLLRDWGSLVARVDRAIPRHLYATITSIVRDIDSVLAEFLRGQLLVVVVMTVYYVSALWLAGLEFALPVGIITGSLVFVPYVGALTGFVLGTIAAVLQFGSLEGVAWVWAAFLVGQAIEGMIVTPTLVGERIGLHPVAVIFALLAFGQVFGFFGVLLALPASAALLVGLRRLRRAYYESPLYGGAPPPAQSAPPRADDGR